VTYLLDTSAISAIMRGDGKMASWLSSLGPDDRVMVCPVTRGEILFGLERLAAGKRRSDLEMKAQRLFAALACEPIPPGAGDNYASVKVARQRRGVPLDENDLWIAATALAVGATLVTHDRDFREIEGLAIVVP
jgi:predicted nucleic acid-binding protein